MGKFSILLIAKHLPSPFLYRSTHAMRFTSLLSLLLIFLLAACGGSDNPEEVPEVSATTGKPKPKVEEFLQRFAPMKLPATVPSEEIRAQNMKPVEIEFYDTYVVGDSLIFNASDQSAYRYYSLLETNNDAYHAIIMVEQKEDGQHFHLVTLKPDGSPIDRQEIAHQLIGLGMSSDLKARINRNMVITCEGVHELVRVPESKADLRDGQPVVRRSQTPLTGSYRVAADGNIQTLSETTKVEPAS